MSVNSIDILNICSGKFLPRTYGPLFYGNHTVTVKAQSAIALEEITITHLGKAIMGLLIDYTCVHIQF